MEWISLGSNCSITYQLNKHKLRTNAYPFDWVKISITQLIDVLTNDFDDFAESIEYKKTSPLHPILEPPILEPLNWIEQPDEMDSQPSLVLTNRYKLLFSHELTSKYELDEFRDKIKSRIDRFRNLQSTNSVLIKFVRIELTPIKADWGEKIKLLMCMLDKIVTNYELILIINSQTSLFDSSLFDFPSNTKIYTFGDFSPDWKMDALDWKNIFGLL